MPGQPCGHDGRLDSARALANLLLNCWEGAALRSRLSRDPTPLDLMLDFYFSAATRAS